LGGTFRYNIVAGGFLQKDSVGTPDMQHFNGNQTKVRAPYLSSFQLIPYYKYSNTAGFFTQAHVEHHLNGLLTNKIPLFRKLNWNMVTGANAFYINRTNNYIEAFVGLENILRLLRIDFYWGFEYGRQATTGFRFGITGFGGGGGDD
jgi:hypothetical protein